MEPFKVDKPIFKFQYLPEYSLYLLNNKLEEFVTVGIRFCREIDLPMLRPLAKLSEKELVDLSMESNRQILTALYQNDVGTFIETNINNWIANKIGGLDANSTSHIDKTEIVAEDITLVFYIRRKLFSFFLYGYTQNTVLHMLIAGEVDIYTTQEELISLKAYLAIHKEIEALNKEITD